MASLIEDLKTPKQSLSEFIELTIRVLSHIENVVSERTEIKGYEIFVSRHSGSERYARPIRSSLFIEDPAEFRKHAGELIEILGKLSRKEVLPINAAFIIDATAYTMQQATGVGFDLLGEANSARKHVGNRFEELVRLVMTAASITNGKVVFKIPYPSEGDEKMFSCETDMMLSGSDQLQSTPESIDESEIVVSLKTSSKDRMGKIFLDKMLMEQFSSHPVKVVGIFHNDVQRKKKDNISYTFVSGLFMVYTEFLCELEGVYFLDPPPITEKEPYKQHIASFSRFLMEDLAKLLSA